MTNTWANVLFGQKARLSYLMLAAAFLLLVFLGVKDIWTQEHRWADIVSGMFYRKDFFHPFLGDVEYYDKPLMSYWLIALSSKIFHLTTFTLRLPSALAGLLSIWSIYKIGAQQNSALGYLSAWLLLSSFYFIFWVRTSSADMLNLGGSLFAVAWFLMHKDKKEFTSYLGFFLILAMTALCKGLIGVIVPLLVILPFLLLTKSLSQHLNAKFFLSLVPALLIYIIPFYLSSHLNGTGYAENGLYLVYKENVLRFFQPFDHKGPIYTYFIFLPVYLFPWTLLFIPALIKLPQRWQGLSLHAKWYAWATFLLFIFLTASGSRRNYYVLPVVPFALLMTADWLMTLNQNAQKILGASIVVLYTAFASWYAILQPLYYCDGGLPYFANHLQTQAMRIKPWSQWQFVMLDAESKVSFYLSLPPSVKNESISGERVNQTVASLLQSWPMLQNPSPKTIYISRALYKRQLQQLLPEYRLVEGKATFGQRLLNTTLANEPIAFIPS